MLGAARRRWSAWPPTWRAIAMILVAGVVFSFMSAAIRIAQESLHTTEVAFFRNLFGLVFMLPWLSRKGLSSLRTGKISLHLARASIGLVGMLSSFYAWSILPMSDVQALLFTAPLFVTLIAPFILKEKVGWRRYGAVVVGLAGVFIAQPVGVTAVDPAVLLILGASLTFAFNTTIVKTLARTEPADAIVIYMVLIMTPISLVPALFFWQWPSLNGWLAVIAVGGLGTAGHVLITRGFVMADASFVVLFDYVRMPYIALIGWVMFGEATSLRTWIGAAVIAAAGVYIARREALRAQARSPAELASVAPRA